ncbi:MAG: hypothetical protein WDW38_007560 [Sanguina aurantia]
MVPPTQTELMRGLGADSRRPKPASGAQPQGWVLLDLAPALDPPPSQKPSWPAQIRKWSICKVLASFTRQHSARMPAQLAMSRTFHHTSQTTMAHPVELQGRLTSETLDYLHKDCHGVPRPAHWVPEHDAQRSPHRERSHRVHTLMTDPSSSHAAMALSCLVSQPASRPRPAWPALSGCRPRDQAPPPAMPCDRTGGAQPQGARTVQWCVRADPGRVQHRAPSLCVRWTMNQRPMPVADPIWRRSAETPGPHGLATDDPEVARHNVSLTGPHPPITQDQDGRGGTGRTPSDASLLLPCARCPAPMVRVELTPHLCRTSPTLQTIATIVASTAAFVFESVPTYADVPDARLLFLWVDLLSVQIFAADYVVRWVQHTRVQPAVGGRLAVEASEQRTVVQLKLLHLAQRMQPVLAMDCWVLQPVLARPTRLEVECLGDGDHASSLQEETSGSASPIRCRTPTPTSGLPTSSHPQAVTGHRRLASTPCVNHARSRLGRAPTPSIPCPHDPSHPSHPPRTPNTHPTPYPIPPLQPPPPPPALHPLPPQPLPPPSNSPLHPRTPPHPPSLGTCPQLWPFLRSPFNMIDLVAIAPWYLSVILQSSAFHGTAVFRILRLFRVFRVFKLGGRYKDLTIVAKSLAKSKEMLALMVCLISFSTLFFSTLMFFVERGHMDERLGYYADCRAVTHPTLELAPPPRLWSDPSETGTTDSGDPVRSPYASIPSSMWWCIVTLMTVGYGDVVPVTAGGRLVAGCTMVAGILCIALPISVVGGTFSHMWQAHKEKQATASYQMEDSGSSCVGIRLLGEQLALHSRDVEDLLHLHLRTESSLTRPQKALTGLIKARRKDQEAARKSDLAVARQAWLGHEQVSMKARLGQLLERGQLSSYDAELVEALRLGEDITDKTRWGHHHLEEEGRGGGGVRRQLLVDVLRLSHLVSGLGLRREVTALRLKHRQLTVMQTTSDRLKVSVDEMADEILEAEQSLTDLSSRYDQCDDAGSKRSSCDTGASSASSCPQGTYRLSLASSMHGGGSHVHSIGRIRSLPRRTVAHGLAGTSSCHTAGDENGDGDGFDVCACSKQALFGQRVRVLTQLPPSSSTSCTAQPQLRVVTEPLRGDISASASSSRPSLHGQQNLLEALPSGSSRDGAPPLRALCAATQVQQQQGGLQTEHSHPSRSCHTPSTHEDRSPQPTNLPTGHGHMRVDFGGDPKQPHPTPSVHDQPSQSHAQPTTAAEQPHVQPLLQTSAEHNLPAPANSARGPDLAWHVGDQDGLHHQQLKRSAPSNAVSLAEAAPSYARPISTYSQPSLSTDMVASAPAARVPSGSSFSNVGMKSPSDIVSMMPRL